MENKLVYLSEVPPASEVELFAAEPDVMGAAKAAELLGVSVATVRREINRGNLEAVHVGRCVRIKKTALLKYLKEAVDA